MLFEKENIIYYKYNNKFNNKKMPSALFEIYQKNFEKTLKKITELLDLYQKQTKELQSITLKETEFNISEMERAISQMELEVIIEKIPDNKKKLNKIIEANKNIVKQYKREIQDLKYKESSILNKKNLAYIPSKSKKKKTELNLLKNNNYNTDDEDIALFINKNNEINNGSINMINNDNFRDEINLTKDKEIKRINDYGNKSLDDKDDNIRINNTNDLDFFSNFSNNNIIKKKEKDKTKNDMEDKDSQENKYKKNKNNLAKKILKIFGNIIYLIITIIIAFCKNIIYKGFINLRNYFNRKYGYTNAMRIMITLIIISFIFIYCFFLFLFASKTKIKENKIDILNNKTVVSEIAKNELNDTSVNNTKIISENNITSTSNVSNVNENKTLDKT